MQKKVAGDFCIPAAIFMQIFVTGQKNGDF
jgi:hypothetical protein